MQVTINEKQEREEVIINCREKDNRVRKIEDYVNQIAVEINVAMVNITVR